MPVRDLLVPFKRRTLAEASILQADGQLRHHFWGDYAATIVLRFASAADATAAQKSAFPNWKQGTGTATDMLQFHGTGAKLEAEEAKLIKFGADAKKLKSVAKSIDHGEVFQIKVPVGYTELPKNNTPQPTQGGLF